jgi:AP2-associated kinase
MGSGAGSPTGHGNRHHRRNVSDTSAFNKAFATETTQFLAPFEASGGFFNPLDAANVLGLERAVEGLGVNDRRIIPNSASHTQLTATKAPPVTAAHASSTHGLGPTEWNPFQGTGAEMSQDHIFVQEFDKLRRGSQNGEF